MNDQTSPLIQNEASNDTGMLEQQYDDIVIGSGLAGLTTAAKLSLSGRKVLVLEQHFQIGGCATCFKRKNDTFEVSLHQMDFGQDLTDAKQKLFKELEIDKNVKFVKTNELWGVHMNNKYYRVPSGIENARKYFIDLFPEEQKGINTYFNYILNVVQKTKLLHNLSYLQFFAFPIIGLKYLLCKKSIGQFLDEVIQNKELKQLININSGYYTDNVYKLNLTFYSFAQANYYQNAVFIQGGSEQLSQYLAKLVQHNGGNVFKNCNVTEILTKQKNSKDKLQATGVKYYDKTKKKEIQVDLNKNNKQSTIICNCSPINVYKQLLKAHNLQKYNIHNKEEDNSQFIVYFSCCANISSIYPQCAYATFIEAENTEQNPLYLKIEKRAFSFVNYSCIDSKLTTQDRSVCTITLTSYILEWKDLDKLQYDEKKKYLIDYLLNRLQRHFPQIRSYIDHNEASTPLTISKYIQNDSGNSYGFKQQYFSFKHRMPSKDKYVTNLHYASAYSFPGGGFTGALLGGDIAANSILNKHFLTKRILFTAFLSMLIFLIIISIVCMSVLL